MHLKHSFTVPVGVDEAWKILLDIERIAPCMPGAAVDSVDGDDFTGTVKVKLGPINLTYKGKASFVEKDEAARRAVIDARGRDARGNGTAAAKVTATLAEADGSTTVQVNTDLDITGKPAQFGRGVMVDVGNKLIGQFADALAATLQTGGVPQEPAAASAATAAPPPAKKARARTSGAASGKTPATAEAPSATKPAAARPATKRAAARPAATEPAAESAAEPQGVAPADPPTQPAADRQPDPAQVEASAEAPGAESAFPDVPAAEAPTAEVPTAAVAEAPTVNGHPASMTSREPQPEVEPINLLEHAGPAVAKRLAPVAVGMVIVFVVVRRWKGRHA